MRDGCVVDELGPGDLLDVSFRVDSDVSSSVCPGFGVV